MDSFTSYPKILTVGHGGLAGFFDRPVVLEEKVDGSQFSMGVSEEGELKVRSKGAQLNPDAPEKMFGAAVETAKRLAPLMVPGWTYRGEYLARPKHNTLAYERIPAQHVILFDINTGRESYLSHEDKAAEAERLGLECVPVIHRGMISSADEFRAFLETVSVLGGQKIEGVVAKQERVELFGADGKALVAKFVSEAFKEAHAHAWRETSPKSGDILERLQQAYCSQARWQKAVQRLAESGRLEGSPRDIGAIMREVWPDIEAEEAGAIKEALYKWAAPHIARAAVRGLPEWYKDKLLRDQFESAEAVEEVA